MPNKYDFKHFLKLSMFVIFLSPAKGFADPSLNQVQVAKTDDGTRITLTLKQTDEYQVFTLDSPNRLVVDLEDTDLRTNLRNVVIPDANIKRIRSGTPDDDTLRIVFDLNAPVRYKYAIVMDNAHKLARLVIDITSRPANSVAQTPRPEKINARPKVVAMEKEPTQTTKEPDIRASSEQKAFVIVIDPGHGGKDPGTIGVNGTQEKTVVLNIARELAALIKREPGMRAVLTRDNDVFVTLRDRLRITRKNKGSLFIAIHADSYFDKQSSGASIYALSKHGATTEAARWLAKNENNSELGGVDLGELSDKSVVLRSVLIDLAQTATITDSVRLGANLLETLSRVTKLHYYRVEQAPFVVLKSPDIPSVLVETGFLTNPRDEENLSNKAYREKLAAALLSGIKRYLYKHPAITV